MLRAALTILGLVLTAIGVQIVRSIGVRFGWDFDAERLIYALIGGLFLFFGLGLIVSVWLERPVPRE